LILDDCPEDDRSKVVQSYSDPRLRYLKNERNTGISASRNRLMNLAQGAYLAIFDHDDVSYPTRLEKEVAFLDAHPEIGLVSSAVHHIPKDKIRRNPETDEEIRLWLMEHCVISHSACMIRQSVLQQHHIAYEGEYSPSEDYALFSRLIGVTKVHNLPDVLLDYRMYAGNTSKAQAQRMQKMHDRISALNQVRYPDLWRAYRTGATTTRKIKLFGLLPLIKIVDRQQVQKGYLFDKILLWTTASRRLFGKKL
jgi:glycosyltransferase involved in cell wall biosynthesis